MSENKTFKQLNSINVNDKIKSKMNLNYLSWSYAWGELLNNYPDAFMTVYTRSVETVETTVQEDKENGVTKTTTAKSIQDILEFAPGTIIELNKIAGEPIDVLVNGKYVARGEVVVIEENFGVRVTEIIK